MSSDLMREDATEQDPLLGIVRSKSRIRKLPWYKRPHPGWLMPFILIFGLTVGAQIGSEMEIWTQLACREVERHTINGGPIGPIGMTAEATPSPQLELTSLGFRKVVAADEEWAQRCRQSAKVTQKTTQYLTSIVTLVGAMGAATAGFWGAQSDRHGRVPILALGTFFFMLDDARSILIITFPEKFAFRSAFMMNVLAGFFVGPVAMGAITNAYVSDATAAGSRSTIFGVLSGLGAVGIAAGPTLGALLLRLSGGMILLPFYLDFGMRIIYLIVLILIIPESLPPELRSRRNPVEEDQVGRNRPGFARRVATKAIEEFKLAMSPLTVLTPRNITEESDLEHPLALSSTDVGAGAKDWNVTTVATSYVTFALISGIMTVKILYVRYSFNWGAEEVSEFISFLAVTNLLVLLFLLPLVVKRMRKPPPLPIRPRPVEGTDQQVQWDEDALRLKLISDSHFDLSLVKASLVIAMLAYGICGLPSTRPTLFLVGTGLLALSAGAAPALQSLALALVSPRDSGRMLASLSVLNSVVMVISQPLFGAVYVYSVEVLPQLVFVVASGLFVVALVPAMAVRLPRARVDREAD